MFQLFWISLVFYTVKLEYITLGDDSQDQCVVSLVIPKDSIKTSCDDSSKYHNEQKMRSIESQLSNVRKQINDLQVKLTYTLTKSKSEHDESDTNGRLVQLESTIPELKQLIKTMETNLLNKTLTDNSDNNESQSEDEPYSRKKLGRIIKSILRKELADIKTKVREEFIHQAGEDLKSEIKDEILTYIRKDGKLINEIQSEILFNDALEKDSGESRKLNVETENPFTSTNTFEHIDEHYDLTRSALDNEFPRHISPRVYRSNIRSSSMNNEINKIRQEIYKYQNKQSDILNSYLNEVKSKLEEIEDVKENMETKNDRKIKRLQNDHEDTKAQLKEVTENIVTVASGLRSMQENIENNDKKVRRDIESSERNIIAKITNRTWEIEHIKNQSIANEKLLQDTDYTLRKVLGDLRLKTYLMEQNITKLEEIVVVMNKTLNPDYEDVLGYDEADHEIAVLNTIDFVKDIKKVWPAVIQNISFLNEELESDELILQDKFHNISESLESVYRKNTLLNDRSEQLHNNIIHLEDKVKSIERAMREAALENNEWAPYNFNHTYDCSGCDGGEKFVKKTGYNVGMYVGVVLCSSTRYKIYLSDSLHEMFLNIADIRGFGKDHCEFVGGLRNDSIALNRDYPPEKTIGYKRADWGQIPVKGLFSFFFSTPSWYECGVTIP
ncbi:Fibronectin type 3 domain [Mactra antiquata]